MVRRSNIHREWFNGLSDDEKWRFWCEYINEVNTQYDRIAELEATVARLKFAYMPVGNDEI